MFMTFTQTNTSKDQNYPFNRRQVPSRDQICEYLGYKLPCLHRYSIYTLLLKQHHFKQLSDMLICTHFSIKIPSNSIKNTSMVGRTVHIFTDRHYLKLFPNLAVLIFICVVQLVVTWSAGPAVIRAAQHRFKKNKDQFICNKI